MSIKIRLLMITIWAILLLINVNTFAFAGFEKSPFSFTLICVCGGFLVLNIYQFVRKR